MEINPTNPIVLQSHEQWHKIAGLIMFKLNQKELKFTTEDVARFAEQAEKGDINILLDARKEVCGDGLVVRLVNREEALKMAELDKRHMKGN